MGAGSGVGRVVVVDEEEGTRARTSGALRQAGYDVVGVASPLGVRRAIRDGNCVLIVCDVSPPTTFDAVLERVRAVRDVAADRCPIAICGAQTRSQLSILARACRAAGFMTHAGGPDDLIRGVQALVPARRAELPAAEWGKNEAGSGRRQSGSWALVKLLLIDDSEITLQLMQAHLRQAGFDVRIAMALAELHSILTGWSPNVIVADVNMPEIRGDRLCARLKARVTSDDVLVLLCSSMSERELESLAEAAGADGFVSKEQGLGHFVDRVQAYCRRLSDPIISIQ
jgi:DNA-binding response OmpR family regulator